MGMFNTLTNAINTGKEQYNTAKDGAYKYADSKITEYQEDTKTLLNELDEGASYLNTKIRDGADELIDDMAERNQEFYTGMKDDVKNQVIVVSSALGLEERGLALNEKIDSGAEVIQSAGELLTAQAHEEVQNVGTLNRERTFAHRVIDSTSTDTIENTQVRQFADGVKGRLKEGINTKLTDAPVALAKSAVDVVALTAKTKIALRDPFADPKELKIGDMKTVAVDLKLKAHFGIGGGVTEAREFTTERLGEDDYEATFQFSASAKIGAGESIGKGVDMNVGAKIGTKVTIRGSAKMLAALKENYKNGITMNMDNLKKISPEEITIGGDLRQFVDVSAFVLSDTFESGPGVKAVWTKKEGLHAELSANAKVSSRISGEFTIDLPGDKSDMPNLAGALQLKGTIKTNGQIELKVSVERILGTNTISAEATTSVDLSTLGLSAEEALALIKKGDFNPNDFGIKLDFKLYTSDVIDGGISLDTSYGGVKNHTTHKELLYAKEINVLQRANLRL